MPGHPNLSIGPVVPTGAETTTRYLDYFVGPDVDEAWLEEMLAFDDEVGAEDTVLVERVQTGRANRRVGARFPAPGVRAARRALPAPARGRARRLSQHDLW